jgi:hypothetical protein
VSNSTAATIARRPSWLGAHPASRPTEQTEERRSHLEVVPTRAQRRARPRALYAVVAVASLLVIVVAQLLLSIGISQGAYQLDTLQQKQTTLQRSLQAASEDLSRISSPQNLAANANALGMVSNSNPAYLRLSDGAVLGAPIAADGAAGTVTGGQGNLVPNSLLAGVPLAGQQAQGSAQQDAQAENSTSTGAATGATTPPTVPLEGALPTPVTH